MLLTKEVEILLVPSNIKKYENKGYFIPRRINKGKNSVKKGTKIKVKVKDLTDSCHVKVNVRCDGKECDKPLKNMEWLNYKRNVKEDGKYYCQKCASRGSESEAIEKTRITKLEQSISFYDWCYKYLPKELADYILSRWDDELNIDKMGKVLSPKDISYSSNGLDGKKGFWFKCLKHPEHKPEQKSVNHFTAGQQGSMLCIQCNSISVTHPHIVKFFVNEEDAYTHSIGAINKIPMKCPACDFEKEISIYNFVNQNFGCPRCSDGISYPEKFLFNVLEQLLDKDFKKQLTKTTFKWCGEYRYDFYIGKLINGIIETHGKQHYEEIKRWKSSLEKIQENDIMKEKLAKENGISEYIVIDCRYSTIEWIKNSIMNRDPIRPDQPCLAELLNFQEEDINWLKCHEFACNSLIKKVCDYWDKENKNITTIADKFKISTTTVRKYLKQGNKIGWANYIPSKKNKIEATKVICLTTGEIFNSQIEASKKYKLKQGGISKCCRGKARYAGKLNSEKLIWMYYDKYISII